MMQLSQGHLNTLAYCPRLFQYIYLDQFSMPLTAEQQTALSQGSRFHTLMQQREMGLSTAVVGEDAVLYHQVEQFLAAAPEVMRYLDTTTSPDASFVFRQSEHRRQWVLHHFVLTVVYDLLVFDINRADIFDWKTGWGLPSPEKLEQNWQFKLYPFVLAETSAYPPEQIVMTYWFIHPDGPEAPPNPHKIVFPYSQQKHQAIAQELQELLTQLNIYLEAYKGGRSLPQVDEANGRCAACPFAVRCYRNPQTLSADALLANFDAIHEVNLEGESYPLA